MSEIFCNSCFKTSISSDGVSCYYCGSYETRRVILSNLYLPVPKPDNAGTEGYTQYRYSFPLDTNTETVKEGSLFLDQESTPRKDIDLNPYVQSDHWQVHENFITNECLPVAQTCNAFDHHFTTNWNLMPEDPIESEYPPESKMSSNEIADNAKEDQQNMHPDREASKIKSISSTNDYPAVAGPSGLQGKIKMSKLCEEKVQSKNITKTDSVALRDTKVHICRVCNKNISKHLQDREKYKCCSCTYQTSELANLQMHNYDHRPANICNICEKEYVGDSHNDEHACEKCKKTFRCRTQLREHYLDHREYFNTRCWDCCIKLRKHRDASDKNKPYVCCVCGFRTSYRRNMSLHNRTHTPKIFCKICREEFDADKEHFHGKVFRCCLCVKEYKCKTQLEDHLVDHQKYLSTNCPICKRKLKVHRRKRDKKYAYECCKCLKIIKYDWNKDFTSHLFIHLKLKPIKCDSCGNRFFGNKNFSRHLKNCTSKPFRCEICRVGFDNTESLNMHRSNVHN